MNALLLSERKRVERYRNTLGNLAHSLKTPLAVIRSALGPETDATRRNTLINQQVDRMGAIVQHQLTRAAASGGIVVGQAAVDLGRCWQVRTAVQVCSHKDLWMRSRTGTTPDLPAIAATCSAARQPVRQCLQVVSRSHSREHRPPFR
jgi:hypothetical protein